MTTYQSVTAFLDSALRDKAQQLIKLERDVRTFLPPNLSNAIYAGDLHGQGSHIELVLLVEHSAVATRIRQSLPSLLVYLQRKGWKLSNLRIKIQPATIVVHRVIPSAPKQAILSESGIRNLTRLHTQLPPSPARIALQALLAKYTKTFA